MHLRAVQYVRTALYLKCSSTGQNLASADKLQIKEGEEDAM